MQVPKRSRCSHSLSVGKYSMFSGPQGTEDSERVGVAGALGAASCGEGRWAPSPGGWVLYCFPKSSVWVGLTTRVEILSQCSFYCVSGRRTEWPHASTLRVPTPHLDDHSDPTTCFASGMCVSGQAGVGSLWGIGVSAEVLPCRDQLLLLCLEFCAQSEEGATGQECPRTRQRWPASPAHPVSRWRSQAARQLERALSSQILPKGPGATA